MEKRNKIAFICILVLTIIAIVFCSYSVIKTRKDLTKDGKKFSNEYMQLNDSINEINELPYINLSIDTHNKIKYLNVHDVIESFDNKKAIYYFGYASNNACRNIVESLLKVAEEKDETIYYVDIKDIRPTFEIKDGKIEKLKDGTKEYYNIINYLDDHLNDYTLIDGDGNIYNTGEKKLVAPTLLAVNKGIITSIHEGSLEEDTNNNIKLNEKDTIKLENKIRYLINQNGINMICTKEKC